MAEPVTAISAIDISKFTADKKDPSVTNKEYNVITYVKALESVLIEVRRDGPSKKIDVNQCRAIIKGCKEINIEHAKDPDWVPYDTANMDIGIVTFDKMKIVASSIDSKLDDHLVSELAVLSSLIKG